ncbi:hypothetical protein [Spirosoma litoris]
MSQSKNIYLLEEYIKTLIVTEVVLPGIVPRRWGHEFCRSELKGIYGGLKFVIKRACPLLDSHMVETFEQIEESNPIAMHWFLCAYWEKLVVLLAFYTHLEKCYQANLN